MPVTDRREPAVYVTIEDASYIAPAIETGRVGYIVLLCDRGPHNRIETITSGAEFHKLYGQPDYRRTAQSHYIADKFLQYSSKLLVCRVVPEDSYWSNINITESSTAVAVAEMFTFTLDSKNIDAADSNAYDSFDVGDWIFSSDDKLDEAQQIVSKDNDEISVYTFVLAEEYQGTTGAGVNANKFTAYELNSIINVDTVDDMPAPASDIVYYFYADGAGEYYNNIIIKGVRNIQMERMYTDEDGNPLYKYLFMDLAIYYKNNDGTETLLEGPWTVSLIRRTELNTVIKDLTSGQILYIEDVINDNSKYIRCISGAAVEKLVTDVDAEDRRLQTMLLLSQSNPIATTNIAGGGAQLEEGSDGTGLYDISGNIAVDSALEGLVKQAYLGKLISTDGSVEQLPEVTYPWYEPDKHSICFNLTQILYSPF